MNFNFVSGTVDEDNGEGRLKENAQKSTNIPAVLIEEE